ncbi:hypothetical protein OAS39_10280, partial [Pirellulales bacterium]|nr:hypothetical protein [Pirellulales bacterium]
MICNSDSVLTSIALTRSSTRTPTGSGGLLARIEEAARRHAPDSDKRDNGIRWWWLGPLESHT